MKKRVKRLVFLFYAIIMVISTFLPPAASAASGEGSSGQSVPTSSVNKIDSKVYDQLEKSDEVSFIVTLRDQVDAAAVKKEAAKKAKGKSVAAQQKKHLVRSEVLTELKANAHQKQSKLLEVLGQEKQKGKVKKFKSYYIINAVSFTGTKEAVEKIASLNEVEKIYVDETRQLGPEVEATQNEVDTNIEWNVKQVGTPDAWKAGIDGTGTVVASIDSGVQWDHPALKEKYRGYQAADGSVDHQYSFFDAVSGQAAAYDDKGHGTHVTGTMVGSEPNGKNQIGVAPGAKWIAAKAFNGLGQGADSDILEAAQWILAPGSRVDMAPDVVNNSWSGGSGIDEWFIEIVRTWRAYDIFPVFAAGNASLLRPNGPGTIATPANYPESFAVGASDKENKMGDFSFQGPSPYGEIKPDVTAPGVKIRSAVPGSGYEGGWNGTSMASPHVSAAAALLRQANSSLTVDEIEQILTKTATPLTDATYSKSPNNGYGHGLLNVYDAVLTVTVGMGTIKGNVTVEGEDSENPAFEHTPVTEADEGMQIDLSILARDNVSVESVVLKYKVNDGEWKTVQAERTSGNHLSGDYFASIPAGVTEAGTLTYQWVITDFVGNTVKTNEYNVTVSKGLTIGYFEDFETEPVGWEIVAEGSTTNWEWGIPTSGPNSAVSGQKVYATKLAGNYTNGMREMIVMPSIAVPEGKTYLQFKQWHSFEVSASTGTAYDYGYVMASQNGRDWKALLMVKGDSTKWVDAQVDLSAYAGEGVYIAFYTFSDPSTTRPGWYIDDVALSADSVGAGTSTASEVALEQTVSMNLGTDEAAENLPTLLPLQAFVSVPETGRSSATNPQNGSYAFSHPGGEYTVVAESYGYHPKSKKVQIAGNEDTVVDFTLEEKQTGVISGVVTNKLTGEPIQGAKVYLVEDANIEPAVSAADGSFQLTALEGTYTLKVSHPMHYPTDTAITLAPNGETSQNLSMDPISGHSETIAYDDGTAEGLNYFHTKGNGWAVKMSLTEGKTRGVLTGGLYKFDGGNRPDPGGTEFLVEVYDASGPNGSTGNKLAGPFDAKAIRSHTEWTQVDLSGEEVVVPRDFYLAYVQKNPFPYIPAINKDTNGAWSGRSYSYIDGVWKQTVKSDGNYMIRAVVSYDNAVPEITSPEDRSFTANGVVKVEGKGQPNTTVHLYNNGVEAAVVTSSEEGRFAADVTLAEGENVISAKAVQSSGLTRASIPVTVIVDKTKPVVSIDSPADGAQSNTTTVTIKGKVEDQYLDSVTVNGTKAKVAEGVFEAELTLEQGENSISVQAKDLAGNETTAKVTVKVDSIAPVITIDSPVEGETTHKKSVTVKGQAVDANLQFVRVNGKEIGVKNGVFSTNVSLESGENIIQIWSKDTFGNETWKQVKVIYTSKNGK
ncbi:S8 family serine peptidase [Bacillus sp. B-jedd]|uniref:S8 family serine peptidase n=1 Tax=Bacillus sp. B-jedd TaxID=1476857 RepID=UPI0005155915|nr:S8 family serine peptidase [Bacillus sp. B-jedd]CEG27098.1 Bpr [Bacillus sp. B-jedd]